MTSASRPKIFLCSFFLDADRGEHWHWTQFMTMRRSAVVLLLVLICLADFAHAQAAESATARQFTITAGAMGSAFNPNDRNASAYVGGSNYLMGPGAYVDVRFTHWFQLEGEARWLRFNQYAGEYQDNYFLGPKIPIHRFGRADIYGKVMIGIGKMTFPYNYGYGTFTALAYGGGVDYRLSHRLTLRPIDFEFQQWPTWLPGESLYPYGFSAGIGYRVF
jgi:opacity protein-like surface antigen